MSPGGTDASLLALAVGLVVAVSLIAVITVVLRRRDDRRDLPGTQVRDLEARVAAAASPDADTRAWDAATRIAAARSHEATGTDRAPGPVDPPVAGTPAADATSPGAETPDGTAGARPVQDPTDPPAGWPSTAGGDSDAMADAFAWLRIAALVEAGQREQAVELLGATMAISADEAELLVDGLDGAGGRHAEGARWHD
ncbi:hypothetical protein [Micromonospora humida]|uniref:hypothetical protein n=1 Tax=Micromonospora humida TaxID=2809018 RepID=UPI0033C40C0A